MPIIKDGNDVVVKRKIGPGDIITCEITNDFARIKVTRYDDHGYMKEQLRFDNDNKLPVPFIKNPSDFLDFVLAVAKLINCFPKCFPGLSSNDKIPAYKLCPKE